MKIGIVCPYNMFEHSGGVREIVVNVAKGLEAKKHDVKIITPKPMGFKGEVPSDYILLGRSRRLNGALATAGDVAVEVDGDEIDRVLEREKFDVINFHEPWVPVLARQILSRSKNSAHVGTFHASLDDRLAAKSIVSLLTPYGRSIGEKMHLLTATSPASAAVLVNRNKGNGRLGNNLVENLRYIPCAVDLKFYQPFKKRISLNGPGTQTIVYVGRPDKRKGVDWLIKAFGLLVEQMPSTHLMIAGSGDRLSVLKQAVKSGKIANVSFLGQITDEHKRYLLGNADLACFPSLFGEGFGIVLVEAMAMGTPLLAGNNMGYRGVMKGDGLIGLVDPEATQDFANRMRAFLTNPHLRKMMGDWASHAAKQYDYPKVVDMYEAAFKEAHKIWLSSQQPSPEAEKDAKNRRKIVGWLSLRRHPRQ